MEQDLISKKELLELTGISYGQLYRWKRKNLIPEEWFIRKSTFTGQETFFPKEKILARIHQIKNMKEDLSLDELADMFSPNPSEIAVRYKDVVERNIVSKIALDLYQEGRGDIKEFPFENLLYVYVLDAALQSGEISLDEGKILLQTLEEHYAKFQHRNCELMLIRKLGIATCLLVSTPNEVHVERGARVVVRLHMPTYVEQLKMKLA
ncbi:YhbD family protein [Alicyclobacillus pomorum]|jgi:DNA-binding transcriptional MerR regulator|uniref:YhbD family protein n=1 Tax=Alicyclobacillus pomorum TaxID=204470 RepID=UPI00040850FC|nr:YhbD family protein [Alicyclobacillus pomorum]